MASYQKIKIISCILAILSTQVAVAQSTKNKKSIPPNIIVFMVDDMGWQDCSLPFWNQTTHSNKRYRTPNMEQLAAEGVKFTNAYATPICTPTRVSMITGMNAAHHHVTNWTSPLPNQPTDVSDAQFNRPEWNFNGYSPIPGIKNTIYATSYVQLLKDAGYFTIHAGKAHWGSMGTPGSNPYNIGFMVNISGSAIGHPQSYYGNDNYGNIPNKAGLNAISDLQEYHTTDTFLTEALTLEALKSIEDPIRRKQPFYLNLSHYAVHVPIMPDKRFFNSYLKMGIDSLEAAYASLIEGMDKSLGDIMHYLKRKGVADNTIILFISDNGGLSNPGNRSGVPFTQNYPLKSGKGSVYEGGIRVPMIIKWPKIVKPNTIANQYIIIEDFFPTILEMANIKHYKTIQHIDGNSLIPFLKNANYKDTSKVLIWHTPNKWTTNGGPGINYFSAIRKGDWKLIHNIRNSEMELYNLKDDISEQNNLIEKYPKKTQELFSILNNRLTIWNAPIPTLKTSFNK